MDQAQHDHDLLTRLEVKIQTIERDVEALRTAHSTLTPAQLAGISTGVSGVCALLVKVFWS
jgi:hypothetical protein